MNDWKKVLEQMPSKEPEAQAKSAENRRGDQKRNGTGRFLLGALIVLLVVALAFGGFMVYTISGDVREYDLIYPGVTVFDLNLGGYTKEQATDKIRTYSEQYFADKALVLICGDQQVTVPARELVVAVDAEALAARAFAYGRNLSLLARYRMIRNEKPHVIAADVENGYTMTAAENAVDQLIAKVEQAYKPYAYRITETGLTITRGQDGVEINRSDLMTKVKQAVSTYTFGAVTVTAKVTEAVVPDWSLLRNTFYTAPMNAKFEKTGLRTYTVIDEVIGKDVDMTLLQADMALDDWQEKTYDFIYITPEITRDRLIDAMFADVLAYVESPIDATERNRNENIRLAMERINGMILAPGETFSFNGIVGERTEAKGYKRAEVFAGGEKVDDVGGGICQVSSILYLATLQSELKVEERHNHAFTVDYVPLGQDATVQFGYLDYRFTNNTDYPIRIEVAMTQAKATVTFVGTDTSPDRRVDIVTTTENTYPYQTVKLEDPSLTPGETKVLQAGQNGYQCTTYRVVTVNGREQERTKIDRSYYKSVDEKLAVGPGPVTE